MQRWESGRGGAVEGVRDFFIYSVVVCGSYGSS